MCRCILFGGGDDVIAKKWILVEEKVNELITYIFFSKALSFIGRVLVVNCLSALKWWYIISVLQPASTRLYFVPSKGIH